MNKSIHALKSALLKDNHEARKRPRKSACGPAVDFEVYDPKDEESAIKKIEACYLSPFKILLFVVLSLTLLPILVIKWSTRACRFFLYSYTNIENATHVAVHGPHDSFEIIPIQLVESRDKASQTVTRIKRILYRFFPYYFDTAVHKFLPIRMRYNRPYVEIHEELSKGIRSCTDYKNAFNLFGPCQIEVPYKGVLGIFLDEVLSPFYLFQIGSIVLWMYEVYYYYAAAILIMTVVSVIVEIVETRRNLLNIQKMAKYQCQVSVICPAEGAQMGQSVLESAEFAQQPSSTLVPGDIVEVPSGLKMPCDCVLLSGSAIVNEAMLTGESIPVLKTALPYINDVYNPDDDKKYTIYAGTEVIQSRPAGGAKVCAMVVRTGFATIKGSLVRYILYPKPSKFSFYSDSYKYIGVMFCMSFVGMVAQYLCNTDMDLSVFCKKCLDLITITVPPALPAAMSIGTSFALSRLKKKQIYCISPPRVNMAGKIGVFCFDKTGTLTEDGLSVLGYRVSAMVSESQSIFGRFHTTTKGFQPEKMFSDPEVFEAHKGKGKSLFVECMAACHSITRVEGKLIGDPLDIEMFNGTGWILDEPEVGGDDLDQTISAFVMPNEKQKNYDWTNDAGSGARPYQLGIVRRFDFTSKLQRMSAIVQNLRDSKYRLFAKGSPEKIMELSRPESVPANYLEVLSKYTQRGCRVLALGTRSLNINYQQCQKVSRDLVERKLNFLGFLILQNKLKEVTPFVINTMQEAGIRTAMVTGDNAYTAISVARECGMIKAHHVVFLGELAEDDKGKRIQWTPIEQVEEERDRDEVRAEEVNEGEIEGKIEEAHAGRKPSTGREMDASNMVEYIPRQISDSLEIQLEKTSRSVRRSQVVSISREKRKTVLSDDGGESEETVVRYPWEEEATQAYSLAFTGKAFDYLMRHDPRCRQQSTWDLLEKSVVFARMSPDGKAQLVDALQSQGFLVGMCGDGANDCVALKAADVGISLSEAEASIAAPFTSKTPDISCVVKVLREGRAALSTSFQCFKYMALYSMIQFTSISVMYCLKINLTDMQMLFTDLFLIVPLAITMSWTRAASGLARRQPSGTLICLPVLASIMGQVIIQSGFQLATYYYATKQDWYDPPKYDPSLDDDDERQKRCQANTIIYLISSMQYVATVVAFSIGKPFRKPMYTNVLFTINAIVIAVLIYYLILSPDDFTYDFMGVYRDSVTR